MSTNLTDEQLVEFSVSGDTEAFDELVRRWERKLLGLCFGILGREDDARDALQETFIAAYKNLSKFRGDAKVSSWLHRIAVNQCLTVKRRARSRAEDLLDDSTDEESRVFLAPSRLMPSAVAERDERTVLIRNAVASLPLELREIVIMKEFEDMTFQQIAEALETPLSTVKSRLYTALGQLRRKLERTSVEVI